LVLAVAVSAAVAVAMSWNVVRSGNRVIPGDGADPLAAVWSLAWSGHAVKPGSGVAFNQLFNGNAFYPAQYSLAFGDSLLGYGPITWFLHGTTGLVTAYKVVFVLALALSALGGYALSRQLGAHPVGAAVAGAAFAFAPWHIGQYAHVALLSGGPVALSLAMLARGHGLCFGGTRGADRPLWVLLGWLLAAWQLTLGITIGLPFAYLLAAIVVASLLIGAIRLLRARREQRRPRRIYSGYGPTTQSLQMASDRRRPRLMVLADLAGVAIFAAVAAVMAYPYLRVDSIDPAAVRAARGLDQVSQHSPKLSGLVLPPPVYGTWSWLTSTLTSNDPLESPTGELRLLPGAILLALAVLGLVVSNWRWWWRLALVLVTVLVGVLTLGTRFPGLSAADSPFVQVWRHVPGWAAVRDPGSLIVFVTLALALLAAGAVSRLAGWGTRFRPGRPGLRVAVLLVLPVLVGLEGWAHIPLTTVPAVPKAMATAPGPTLVLPSIPAVDSQAMFWSTTRDFPAVANGYDRLLPSTLGAMRAELLGFPDARSVQYLRRQGFRSVVVLKQPLPIQLWQNAGAVPDPSLGLTRTDLGDSILYTLSPSSP
jgi:hypothetical protein